MDDVAGRIPDAAEIAEINARHLITTPLKPADLLFLFGTRHDEVLRAETACGLWHEKMFRWAIVSGGVTPGSHLSECAVIRTERSRSHPRHGHSRASANFTGASSSPKPVRGYSSGFGTYAVPPSRSQIGKYGEKFLSWCLTSTE